MHEVVCAALWLVWCVAGAWRWTRRQDSDGWKKGLDHKRATGMYEPIPTRLSAGLARSLFPCLGGWHLESWDEILWDHGTWPGRREKGKEKKKKMAVHGAHDMCFFVSLLSTMSPFSSPPPWQVTALSSTPRRASFPTSSLLRPRQRRCRARVDSAHLPQTTMALVGSRWLPGV